MSKSLLEELPKIVANGRKVAEKILEGLESKHRIGLQTREWVLPSRDSSAKDWISEQQRAVHLSGKDDPSAWANRLIYGDNLLAIAALLAGDESTPSLRGKVDLIYIDPPFDSKADYRTKITLPGAELQQKPTVLEQFAYSDTWSKGTSSYLASIMPRLILMRELMKDSGALYVHLDWHVAHYVKIVLDEVFGKQNFINEIIWQGAIGDTSEKNKKFIKSHDTLLFYRKDASKPVWNDIFQEFSSASEKLYKYSDEKGIYRIAPIDNPGGGGYVYDLGFGEIMPQNGYRMPFDTAQEWLKAGILLLEAGKVPGKKLYRNPDGVRCRDVWTDISSLQGAESVGYGTQKPRSLLERVVSSSTNTGDLVLDLYSGSGTTASVCEKMDRRWIATDMGKPACMIMRKRLIDQGAKPFLYQAVGDYHVEAIKAEFGRRFRVGDLTDIVLSLYGAVPIDPELNPMRNLGRIPYGNSKTLVLVDSPAKMTGLPTLRRAISQRENLMGGWDRVVVLGWNFASSIGQDIENLNQGDKLEVLAVPPDIMDRLKKKGGIEKLRGDVKFSGLQYVTIKPIKRRRRSDGETLEITLDRYVQLSPEATNLDDASRIKLQEIANREPLSLIEYWAVDPDYDGEVFRSVWQDYRENTENDGDPLRVITNAEIQVEPVSGTRRVCVRVVDVFGLESQVIQDVTDE